MTKLTILHIRRISIRFLPVQVVLIDIVDDRVRHQELDGVSSTDRKPNAGRTDHVGNPFGSDVNVLL